MDLEKYEELTGKVIPESKQAYYEAQIKRATSKLETLLGYTFTSEHLYTELGKTQQECICPSIPQSSELLPADEVEGYYRVFPYHYADKFIFIDPFIEVYNVKLVRVLEDKSFITYKTFETITKQYMSQGIGKYIEKCSSCFCDCDCKDCVQLAVDADWVDLEDLPDDIWYLWADMIDYYADPTKDIKSESVDGHSWSKGDIKSPEERDMTLLLLKRYAGPFGSITRMPTV